MSRNNRGSNTAGIWLAIFIFGMLTYVVFVMPLRIIFKHPDKSYLSALMPYSNVLGLSALISFIIYGLATGLWFVVAANVFSGGDNGDLRNTLIVLSVFGLVLTGMSIYCAWCDVREAMEAE